MALLDGTPAGKATLAFEHAMEKVDDFFTFELPKMKKNAPNEFDIHLHKVMISGTPIWSQRGSTVSVSDDFGKSLTMTHPWDETHGVDGIHLYGLPPTLTINCGNKNHPDIHSITAPLDNMAALDIGENVWSAYADALTHEDASGKPIFDKGPGKTELYLKTSQILDARWGQKGTVTVKDVNPLDEVCASPAVAALKAYERSAKGK